MLPQSYNDLLMVDKQGREEVTQENLVRCLYKSGSSRETEPMELEYKGIGSSDYGKRNNFERCRMEVLGIVANVCSKKVRR